MRALDTVMRLFDSDTSGSLIMSIGTTSAAPAAKATMKRARLSTNGETSSGGWPCRYSSIRLVISRLVYVRLFGKIRFRMSRRGSVGLIFLSSKRP